MIDFDKYPFYMIRDCNIDRSMMTDIECEFIDSISKQIDEGRNLSDRQIDELEDIWEKVTENGQ